MPSPPSKPLLRRAHRALIDAINRLGWVVAPTADYYHPWWSWLTRLLPFVEQDNLYRQAEDWAHRPGTEQTYPWPEPWRWSRGALPRTEFWDVATGSWRSRGPVLHPKDD